MGNKRFANDVTRNRGLNFRLRIRRYESQQPERLRNGKFLGFASNKEKDLNLD